MGTCLPPVTRTSQQLREGLPCREGFLCPSPIRRQRWTWPQRHPSPLSRSTPPRSQPPTYQRLTTSHAKRSMPKKLGRGRSPPRHYSSNRLTLRLPAGTSVTWQRWIHSHLKLLLFLFFYLSCYIFFITRRHIISSHKMSPSSLSQQSISWQECIRIVLTANTININ